MSKKSSSTSEMAPKQTSEKKVRGKGKKTNSMRLYIKKLAKENMGSGLQLSTPGAEYLELVCDTLLERLATRAGRVVEMKKSRTLNAVSVQGAASLEFHPSLAKLCDDVATEKVKLQIEKA